MTRARILSAVTMALVPLVAQADSKVVLQRSNLRGAPSQTAKLLAVLHAGSVVDAEAGAPTSGYVKVKLSGPGQGTPRQGWILAKNLEDSLVVAGMVSDEPGVGAGARKPEGCNRKFSAYSECPQEGCGKSDAQKVFNALKNSTDAPGEPRVLAFSDFHAIEDAVEARDFRGGSDLGEAERQDLLHNVGLDDGSTISEGDLVALAGFISIKRTLSCGSQESCNCDFINAAHDSPCSQTDIHVPLVERPTLGEEKSVVVELTPRVSTLDSLRNASSLGDIQMARQQVLVVGRLFFDNAHVPNPSGTISGQPKRFTLWEIHPIKRFLACPAGHTCDPETPSVDWKELGS